jgi:hypothetical protein
MLLNQTGIQSQQTMQKFWAKTMLLNQTGDPVSTNYAKILGQNHAAQPNWDVLTFLQPILICKCHVLSTGRVWL